ncbi:hypothetical protein AB1L88_26925 [Tautonia sp. JC769]|uniref:hypothetical protein n=1 Tax=Tautonia sp. JC769 TaxID=3232135 RepID=UPI003459167D
MTLIDRDLRAWLYRICRSEKPPSSVVAYNVGLSETAFGGYAASLIGADRYVPDDPDWACDESFAPSERFFPIPAGVFSDWELVQEAVAAAVRDFVRSPEGDCSFLASAEAVTVGFDDGDLVRVR